MKFTPKISLCIEYAALRHEGQVRKWGDIPYASHPFALAFMVSEYTSDEDVICAALLHDVIEDVPGQWRDDIREKFGERVLQFILEVSEDKDPNIKTDERATWAERKRKYVEGLKHHSKEALLIVACDKYHNLLTSMQAYEIDGDKVFERFNAPIEKRMELYRKIIDILQKRLQSPIVEQLSKLYAKALALFEISNKG